MGYARSRHGTLNLRCRQFQILSFVARQSKGIAIGLAVSLSLHVSVMAWPVTRHPQSAPVIANTLFVGFVPPAAAPAPEKAPLSSYPESRPVNKPVARQWAIKAPEKSPPALTLMIDAATTTPEASAENPVQTFGPLMLSTETSIICPEQPAPAYPSISRRLGEEGIVTLKLELDERGQVSHVNVATHSAYPRLDEAAKTTVSAWHCSPSLRNGQPVRTTIMQTFKFMLQGN